MVKVASGEDPAAEKQAAKVAVRVPADADFVESVVSRFIERYAKANTRESTWVETERVLNKEIARRWKGRPLSAIGRSDVHEMLDEIVDRPAPILANRTLALFRRMCNWAVERGIITTSPCEGVKAPAPAKSRDRVLSDEELKAVWQACDGLGWPFGHLIKLLALTGQRRDEIASMRWSEVDLEARSWTLPRGRAKNDQASIVPLSGPAIALLEGLPRITSKENFVFTARGETAVSGFAKAKERLDALVRKVLREGAAEPEQIELQHWVLHDLRRTFASGAARLGINLPVIEKVLNHVSGSFGRDPRRPYQRHWFAGPKARGAGNVGAPYRIDCDRQRVWKCYRIEGEELMLFASNQRVWSLDQFRPPYQCSPIQTIVVNEKTLAKALTCGSVTEMNRDTDRFGEPTQVTRMTRDGRDHTAMEPTTKAACRTIANERLIAAKMASPSFTRSSPTRPERRAPIVRTDVALDCRRRAAST